MKALVIKEFKKRPSIDMVKSPTLSPGGVIVKVEATGICRSDWHGWQGHDQDILLPHVPGHELVGTIVEKDVSVKLLEVGDRVTVPFVSGCGKCGECQSGHPQICDNQYQPGFSAWGSFAEYTALRYADLNLVKVPEEFSSEATASLGCRFVTAFRGIVDVGEIHEEMTVGIHGCGGVGLSGIMIAKAFGAQVIAVDINEKALELARALGADHVLNGSSEFVAEEIKDLTNGGCDMSVDALGSGVTAYNSISSLRKRGSHIQIGLMEGEDHNPKIPMHLVLANELKILGSHGIQSSRYEKIFEMISEGRFHPEKLIHQTINLDEAADFLVSMDKFHHYGVTVINQF